MRFLLLIFLQVALINGYSQKCGTKTPPKKWAKKFQELTRSDKSKKKSRIASTFNIPVIVHILHDGDIIGSDENISHQQIVSQIEALNRDFGATNPNVGNLPSEFSTFLAGNTGITFCLAKQGINGNSLTEEGVDRINWNERGWRNPASILNSTTGAINNYFNSVIKPATIWNPTKYLNIWVSTKNDFLPIAGLAMFPTFPDNTTFPEVPLTGDYIETNLTSGIWMHHASFGTSGTASANDGTIVTHELGHWLGLFHTFEDWDGTQTCGGNTLALCDDGGDYCCDTPPQDGASNDCSLTRNTCGTLPTEIDYYDMTMNYMNYGDCKYMFTDNQVERMQATMTHGTFRASLPTSIACDVTKPDLIILNPQISSATITAGVPFTVYFAEDNIGGAAASPNYVSFHLSSNNILTPGNNGDFYVDEHYVNQILSPFFQTIQLSKQITLPANTSPGTYYLFFSADGSQIINESDEENNFATVLITVLAGTGCAQPVVSAPQPRTVTAPAGTSFNVSASGVGNSYQWEFNNGAGWASLSNTTPYSGVFTNTLSINSTQQNMNGYIFRCRVTNSCGSSTNSASAMLTVNVFGTSCNNDIACAPRILNINSTCLLTNCTTIGANPPSPEITFISCAGIPFQSGRYDDDVWFSITPNSNNPVTIKAIPTSNLNNFDISMGLYSGNCTGPTQIGCATYNPAGYAEDIVFTPVPGTQYLIRVFSYGIGSTYSGNFDICVKQESNNTSPTEFPDLEIDDVSSSTNTPCAGNNFSISYQVENYGDVHADNFKVKFYLSIDDTYSSNDELLATSTFSGLNANDDVSRTKTLTLPSSTGNGQWHILIIADADNEIDEGNDGEDNNRHAEPITVNTCNLADIIITYTGVPPTTGIVDENVQLTYQLNNIGGVTTTPQTRVGCYISYDDTFDPETDIFFDDDVFNRLDPGEVDNETTNFSIPECQLCGNYYIIMVADYQNLVPEGNEENNIYVFPIELTGCITCSTAVPPTGMNFPRGGGTGNIGVTTTSRCCKWSATTNASWITIINASGEGDGFVNYLVAACDGADRTGVIYVDGQAHVISQNCASICNNSLSFEWAAQAGSIDYSEHSEALACDASGNLYMTGSIQTSVDFGNNIILTTPTIRPDIFVSKHNSMGEVQWAVRFGSNEQEGGSGIATDSDGNIYVIGSLESSVAFGTTLISSNGINNSAAFLLKLTPTGNVLWVQKINSNNHAIPTAIAIDASNQIFITGYYSDFNSGGDGFFIASYSHAGVQLMYQIYGLDINVKNTYGIAVNSNHIFICGRYLHSLTIGPITLTATNGIADTDGFVAKLDRNGNVMWAKKLTSPGQGTDELRSIAIDANENVYTIGNVDSSAIIDNLIIPLSPSSKTIMIKYDFNGNPIWAKASTEGNQYNTNRVAISSNADIYFTGNFSDSLRIDTFLLTSLGGNENFIGRMDEDGKIKWLKSYGGLGSEFNGGLALNNNNDIFLSGSFASTASFDKKLLTSYGDDDIFLAKYNECNISIPEIDYGNVPVICPGQTLELSTASCSYNLYQWYLGEIEIPNATNAYYTADMPGSYKIKVTAYPGCQSTSTSLLLKAQETYTFIGNGNWNVSSNWSNNMIPPSPLLSCTEIIINPIAGGECILNVPQIVPAGANITVQQNANFNILGNLIIQN